MGDTERDPGSGCSPDTERHLGEERTLRLGADPGKIGQGREKDWSDLVVGAQCTVKGLICSMPALLSQKCQRGFSCSGTASCGTYRWSSNHFAVPSEYSSKNNRES